MPLFGPPNIAQLEAKRDVQGLIKALAYKDSGVRIAAADALAPLKDPIAVEPLVELLRDDDAGVREASVRALAARGGVRVVEPLVGALSDTNVAVRGVAATAVFRRLMTDPDQEARKATATAIGRVRAKDGVEPLIKAIMDADEGVRVAAIKALHAIGDVAAIQPLIVVLAHEQVRQKTTGRSSLAVERTVSQALDGLCTVEAIDVLQAALAHDDADVREIAVKRLARIGSPLVADALVSRLDDEDPIIRRAAARGLAEIQWEPPRNALGARYWSALRDWRRLGECGTDAIPFLTDAFLRVDALERLDIVTALGQIGWEPTEQDFLAASFWAGKGDWDKCVAVGPPAVEALDDILRSAPHWRDRVAASVAMSKVSEPRPYPFSRLDLVQQALAIMDGEGSDEDKRGLLEAMMIEMDIYTPKPTERIEWCKCGYPAMVVRREGNREPLADLLGFEENGASAATYYCPNCDTRRSLLGTS